MSSSIPRTSGIYKITCLPTGKVYVGSAANLARRWCKHAACLRRGVHENSYLQHAWNKYGADAFRFVVIELILEPFLLEREQYWLDRLHAYESPRGFNLSRKAGAPMAGRKHTPETLKKMSRAGTGRKHTEETKQMMSVRNKGRWFAPCTEAGRKSQSENGRRLAAGRSHSRHTEEAKEKMRQAARKRLDNPNAKDYLVVAPDGSEFPVHNLALFCREHGLSYWGMRSVLRGRTPHHRGWTCRFLSTPSLT
jgi:group I intron endonuclease